MSDKPAQPDPLPTRCDACGSPFAAIDLKRASLPWLNAFAAVGISDPEDVDPIPWNLLTDDNWYCPSCRCWVNLRRGVGTVILIVPLLLLAVILFQWLF